MELNNMRHNIKLKLKYKAPLKIRKTNNYET